MVRESRRDFAPDAELFVGMRAFRPEYANGDAFAEKVAVAADCGVDGYRFYNYGLIPPAQLAWIRRALEAIE